MHNTAPIRPITQIVTVFLTHFTCQHLHKNVVDGDTAICEVDMAGKEGPSTATVHLHEMMSLVSGHGSSFFTE